jgi:hypothetical protein
MRYTLRVVAFILTAATAAAAQTAPDFSGTWKLDAARTVKANPAGALMPSDTPFTIRQTAAAIIIERQTERGLARTTFALDGAESRNMSIPFTIRTKSRWDGPRLIIEGTQAHIENAGHDVPTPYREVRWIERDGAMVVEITRTMQDKPATVRAYYVRTKE